MGKGLVGGSQGRELLRGNETIIREITRKKELLEERIFSIRNGTTDPEELEKRIRNAEKTGTPEQEHEERFEAPASTNLKGIQGDEEDDCGASSVCSERNENTRGKNRYGMEASGKGRPRGAIPKYGGFGGSNYENLPGRHHPEKSPTRSRNGSYREYLKKGMRGDQASRMVPPRKDPMAEPPRRDLTSSSDEDQGDEETDQGMRHLMRELLKSQIRQNNAPIQAPPQPRSRERRRSSASGDAKGIRMPDFEGKAHEVIEDWLRTWEQYAEAKNISAELRPLQLTNSLGKDVRPKLRALSDAERLNEAVIKTWLRETYGREVERTHASKEYYLMVQIRGKTARDFMDRLKTKWRIAKDGEEGDWKRSKWAKESIRDQFFKGLYNQEVSKIMEDRSRTIKQEHLHRFLHDLGNKTDEEIIFLKSREERRQTTLGQEAKAEQRRSTVKTMDESPHISNKPKGNSERESRKQ